MRNIRRVPLFKDDYADPLTVVVNLFDVAMVFAVALMVSMVMNLNMSDFFSNEDFTIVKKKGNDDVEIIQKKGQKVTKYKTVSGVSPDGTKQKGRRLGTVYEVEGGEQIYVPE